MRVKENNTVSVHPGGKRWFGCGQVRTELESMFRQKDVKAFLHYIHKNQLLVSAAHHWVDRSEVLALIGTQLFVNTENKNHKNPHSWHLKARGASPV